MNTVTFLSIGILVSIGMTSTLESSAAFDAKYSHIGTIATNDCGNGFAGIEINCANDQSIISGDHNVAASSDTDSEDEEVSN